MGYGFDMYDYRIWDEQNKKVIRSRNVTFNENLFYKDKFSTESTCASKLSEISEKATL